MKHTAKKMPIAIGIYLYISTYMHMRNKIAYLRTCLAHLKGLFSSIIIVYTPISLSVIQRYIAYEY